MVEEKVARETADSSRMSVHLEAERTRSVYDAVKELSEEQFLEMIGVEAAGQVSGSGLFSFVPTEERARTLCVHSQRAVTPRFVFLYGRYPLLFHRFWQWFR